jgi:hypothetical protein
LRQEILLLPQNLLPGLNVHHQEETILVQNENTQQGVQSEQGNNELGEPSSADQDLPGVQHQTASKGQVVPSSPASQPGNTNSISIDASTLPAQAGVDTEESGDNADAPAGAAEEPSHAAASVLPTEKIKTRSKSGISKPKVYTDSIVRYSLLTATGEPQTLCEALNDQNWKKAMDLEFAGLHNNKTWHLVAPDKGKNIIDCKWVYKIKRKADGSIDRYKTRLVVKGFK